MRSGLDHIQEKIIAADVKYPFWLFEVDHNNDNLINYYLSIQNKTHDGHDYIGNIISFSPIALPFPDMPTGIIPSVNTTLKIAGMLGIELTPDNTAVADGIGQTEADSVGDFAPLNAPDTFESTDADSPAEGSYHFRVEHTGTGWRGFALGGISIQDGETVTLKFKCKIGSGQLGVGITETDVNDGFITTGSYTNSSYESKTLSITMPEGKGGDNCYIVFRKHIDSSGEFWVDNVSLKRKLPYASDFEGGNVTARLVCGADNIELTSSGTAVSDSQTEADSVGDWTNYGVPDTFESTAISPSEGSYCFHIVENSVLQAGINMLGLTVTAGKVGILTFDLEIISGKVRVLLLDGDQSVIGAYEEYTDIGSYSSETMSRTITVSGDLGGIVIYKSNTDGGGEFYIDNVKYVTYAEIELMAWKFKINSTFSVEQVLTLNCQDFFTHYLEGDYPNTPLVSTLFPADIMIDDNICVPITFGTPFFPIRWTTDSLNVSYVDVDTFIVSGDRSGQFQVGQFLLANCGVDGLKSCWVDSSSYESDNTTIVNLTVSSDDLTSNLASVLTDQYILGPEDKTYTIEKARTPHEVNFKSTYDNDSAGYEFIQGFVWGKGGVKYKCVQLLADDADEDGTNDANGYWGVIGKEVYDLPMKYSRNDTVSMTSPEKIVEYILEDWGIPSADIDSVSQASVNTIFSGRGFTLDISLWHQVPRTSLISKLFTVAGMIPVYRDTIGFKVLTKVSQDTITEALVKPGTFRINPTYTKKQKDSGYVTWQKVDDSVDMVNKSLIAAKSNTDKPSDTNIECEWVLDSIKAQKAGKLALQRVLLKDKKINFTAQAKILALEPGDMITIDPTNFGAEGSSYDCMIVKMTIREGLWIDVECIRFSDDLDDWGDLSASEISVVEAETDRAYSPVYQGPTDSLNNSGNRTNEITGGIIIGSGGLVETSDDPALNGGLLINNQSMTGYNPDGNIRFQSIYGTGGATDGDVTIGDYVGDAGIFWDQSATTLNIKGTVTATTGTIGGWTIGATTIYNGTNIVLDSANKAISIKDTTFGNSGIQIQYNSGTPRIYCGDGSTKYFKVVAGSAPEFGAGIIKETQIEIYTSGVIKTNTDPASNGGLLINDESMTGYDTSGNIRFQSIYGTGGATDGDVTIGDYAGGAGIQWDQSATTLNIKVDSAGGLNVVGGGDITLEGSDTDPGIIKFEGSSYSVEMGGDADGNRFSISPSVDGLVDFFIGSSSWWGSGSKKFLRFLCRSETESAIEVGILPTLDENSIKLLLVKGAAGVVDPTFVVSLYDGSSNDSGSYIFHNDYLGPVLDNNQDLGRSGYTWKITHSEKIITYDTSDPIVLAANVSASAPTHSATKGTLYVTSAGVLYINTSGSTTWAKVGGQ